MQCRDLDIFKILCCLVGPPFFNFLEICLEDFFGGIFLAEFFGRIFGRGIDMFVKILFFVKILSQ